ncbi:MAG: transporter ATP-binding protein [Deltaproteobacteria bacterium]|nr:transporter ATP-binding protein [Deltaproteobacteria bacterium]
MKKREMEATLRTQDLTIHFGGLTAIKKVNFVLHPGEIKALIGPNGAGKTTFFNLICGNLKPTEGKIFFQSEEITGLSPYAICRKGISRTYQKTSLFPNLSVRENIRLGAHNGFGGKLHLFRRAETIPMARKKVEEIMELVGLQEKAEQQVLNLSYGDQRLLEIAIGLSTNPQLLLLDEPTAGLSIAESRIMTAKIKDLAKRSIQNVIIVEHDMEVVRELAMSICVLSNGEILTDGPAEEVKKNPKVQEIYWGIGEC